MLIFDFNKAMEQVRELRQIANDMSRMDCQKLTEAINNVQVSWKGQTGQLFLSKCSELQNRIKKEATNINRIADSLEDTARMIDKAEREAARVLTGGLVK